jgi:FlaG/FlaF family flagellin (archaellin)
MKSFSKINPPEKDRGVSTIVGVILMIVVSVILASVVLGFSLSLTDLLQKPPQAGITIQQEYSENGPDDPTYSASVVASAFPNADYVTVEGPVTETKLSEVGDHTQITGLQKGDTVIVTATKGDQTVVIREYTVG